MYVIIEVRTTPTSYWAADTVHLAWPGSRSAYAQTAYLKVLYDALLFATLFFKDLC
jgi:hypothetical protein